MASFGHAFDIITIRRVHTLVSVCACACVCVCMCLSDNEGACYLQAARTEEEVKQWISFIDVHMAAVE